MTLTPERIRAAAQVLVEVSRIYEFSDPELGEWSASDLLNELPHIEGHLEHDSFVQEIVDHVCDAVMAGANVEDALRSVLGDFDLRRAQ